MGGTAESEKEHRIFCVNLMVFCEPKGQKKQDVPRFPRGDGGQDLIRDARRPTDNGGRGACVCVCASVSLPVGVCISGTTCVFVCLNMYSQLVIVNRNMILIVYLAK